MPLSGNLVAQILAKGVLQNPSTLNQKYVYNPTTGVGKGFLLSADGRSGFVVQLNFDTVTGQLNTATSTFAVTQTKASYASTLAGTAGSTPSGLNGWLSGTTVNLTTVLEGTRSTSASGDYVSMTFDDKSIGALFDDAGFQGNDFSNTFVLLYQWAEKVAEIARTESYGWDSGAWSFNHSFITGARPTILFNEGADAAVASQSVAPNLVTTSTSPASSEYALITSNWINSSNSSVTNNAVSGSAKKLVYDAGAGYDILTTDFFASAKSGAVVDLRFQARSTGSGSSTIQAQSATYEGKTFLIAGFEEASLTNQNDTFIGDGFNNAATPGGGIDTLDGGGTTFANGSASDLDVVSYMNASSGIVAKAFGFSTINSVTTGTFKIADYTGNIDTAINFEGVRGGLFNDKFYGGTFVWNQNFMGFKGNDLIDGGGGFDTTNYSLDVDGVVVNLSKVAVNTHTGYVLGKALDLGIEDGTVSAIKLLKLSLDDAWGGNSSSDVKSNTAVDGWGSIDTLKNVEGVTGSAYNDQLFGSDVMNVLNGGAGFDILVGNGGNDNLYGGAGHDMLYGGLGADWIVTDDLNFNVDFRNSWATRWFKDQDDGGNLIVYKSVTESSLNAPDTIDGFGLSDFEPNDIIDLSAIDANTTKIGNQAFSSFTVLKNTDGSFATAANYTGLKAGALIVFADTMTSIQPPTGGNQTLTFGTSGTGQSATPNRMWHLQGDINGDKISDFDIRLIGVKDADINKLDDYIIH